MRSTSSHRGLLTPRVRPEKKFHTLHATPDVTRTHASIFVMMRGVTRQCCKTVHVGNLYTVSGVRRHWVGPPGARCRGQPARSRKLVRIDGAPTIETCQRRKNRRMQHGEGATRIAPPVACEPHIKKRTKHSGVQC